MADISKLMSRREQNGFDTDNPDAIHGYLDPVAEDEVRRDLENALRVEVVTADTNEITQYIADLLESGEVAVAEAEIEDLLQQSQEASAEITKTHPDLCSRVDARASTELSSWVPEEGLPDSDHLDRASLYRQLREKLYQDYLLAAENGDAAAIDEWTAVSEVIDQRIIEHTLQDMAAIIRSQRYEGVPVARSQQYDIAA